MMGRCLGKLSIVSALLGWNVMKRDVTSNVTIAKKRQRRMNVMFRASTVPQYPDRQLGYEYLQL